MFISLIYSLSVFRHVQGGEPASVCSLALNLQLTVACVRDGSSPHTTAAGVGSIKAG